QTVDLASGQTKDLGPIKLKVLKGRVTLVLESKGATVMLVRRNGAGKKIEKKLPDSIWESPPVQIDIDPTENWKLVASKKGYDDFTQELTFDDGKAERTINISLSAGGSSPPAVAAVGHVQAKTEKVEKE